MNEQTRQVDTAIVGAGLGGLATAAFLARAGRSVVVLERSATIGGRAATHDEGGFLLNLGPHALYRGGAGMEVLRELGVRVSGGIPGVSGGFAISGGRKHALPGGFVSLLTTSLFGVGAKLETAKTLGSLPKLDPAPLARVSVRSFLEREVRHPEVRSLLAALFRLATYANCPERQSAGAAVLQLQMALRSNVLYLDGGWRTLVSGLRAVAEAAGARVITGAGVESVSRLDGDFRLRLRDRSSVAASSVVIALPLDGASALLGDAAPSIRRHAAEALPARAACLDVALRRLPDPRATFALGIDRPFYLSVHSAVARLAPEEGALIQVAKYLAPGAASDPRGDEKELEDLLDLVQPGWRGALVKRRFLPSMLASSTLPLASEGGLAGRPGIAVEEMPGLYLVGDWVSADGYLADASLASARAAAHRIARTESRAAA